MPDKKFSEFPLSDSAIASESVGLQGGVNVRIPSKAYFAVTSSASITINDTAATPSFIAPITLTKSIGVSIADAATGAVRNDTGRTIPYMAGTINFSPNKGGGGTTTINLVSERSPDGITWAPNAESLRIIEVSNNGEAFSTKLSALVDWLPNEWTRFICYTSGGGSITFEATSDTIGGNAYTGPSMAWELSEK